MASAVTLVNQLIPNNGPSNEFITTLISPVADIMGKELVKTFQAGITAREAGNISEHVEAVKFRGSAKAKIDTSRKAANCAEWAKHAADVNSNSDPELAAAWRAVLEIILEENEFQLIDTAKNLSIDHINALRALSLREKYENLPTSRTMERYRRTEHVIQDMNWREGVEKWLVKARKISVDNEERIYEVSEARADLQFLAEYAVQMKGAEKYLFPKAANFLNNTYQISIEQFPNFVDSDAEKKLEQYSLIRNHALKSIGVQLLFKLVPMLFFFGLFLDLVSSEVGNYFFYRMFESAPSQVGLVPWSTFFLFSILGVALASITIFSRVKNCFRFYTLTSKGRKLVDTIDKYLIDIKK